MEAVKREKLNEAAERRGCKQPRDAPVVFSFSLRSLARLFPTFFLTPSLFSPKQKKMFSNDEALDAIRRRQHQVHQMRRQQQRLAEQEMEEQRRRRREQAVAAAAVAAARGGGDDGRARPPARPRDDEEADDNDNDDEDDTSQEVFQNFEASALHHYCQRAGILVRGVVHPGDIAEAASLR